MGKGDIKTKRGKITNKSFGKKRPHKLEKKSGSVEQEKKLE
ncbi:30S ribosomal protein THX [Pedobacter sp. SYSU D00535]|nr:30S ribosomal protein THX [Pedobacter sp. SYSU D00535]